MTLRHFVLLAALGAPQAAFALSGSKLGLHVLGDNDDAAARQLLDACPRVAKWLGGSGELGSIKRYRERCPGGQVVIRVYVPNSVHYGLSTDPGAAAEDFWRRVAPRLPPAALVDWVEGVNELDNVEDWYHNGAAAAWFAAFSSRYADLVDQAGYHPLLGSIAVGNPALQGEQLFGAGGAMKPLADVIRSKAYKVGWSYHAYGNRLFNGEDERFWTLRYRQVRDQAGLQGVPLVLTEGGQDGREGGWIGRSSGETFLSWLKWLDGELKKDGEVAGVTLFQVGQHADWGKFDLGPIAGPLAEYLKSDTSVPPPPPPPPQPRPAVVVLKAADGQTFAAQDELTRASFIGTWGAQGLDPERRWLGEHNMDLIDPSWREKTARGEPVANGGAGCFDEPVAAPPGRRWAALCERACSVATAASDCPSGADGQPGWCFGFPGSNRCLRLEYLPD